MPLATGEQLGPYKVLSLIGSGGMGEVYKARDTRLERLVALKISKTEFSERFEREARAVAALNHPNICHLYDVALLPDGPGYLVMEYVEGASVVNKENPGPLPLDRALPLAIQISDALDAAHSKGIVHRDLKPANVLVAADGRPKILDFGLALIKAQEERPEGATQTMGITDPGTTVGTVAFMSPEQARGLPLDSRTDLWSFGVLLYEMLTGARPFEGATTALTFDAILNRTPVPLHERNPKITPEMERIVNRLLEKERETRYQSAAEVRADLKGAERGPSATVTVLAAAPSKPAPKWKFAAAAASILLLAIGGFLLWQRAHAAPLTDKDVLVLADFTNTTGDPVFDTTLREALAVGLEESSFLKIIDDAEVRQTLQLMGRSPKDRITNDIAREICIRTGDKATIGGSIAGLGKTYAITLLANNCQTGATLARQQVEAEDKEHVLKAVSRAASAVRRKLGESLSSINNSDPLGEDRKITTTSLAAFQAFAHGRERLSQGSSVEALRFFEQATQLDSDFALAYLAEGVIYNNLGQTQLRQETLKKAFALTDRVSERERLSISKYYFGWVTGELEKAIDVAEQEARGYPRYFAPHNFLGLLYSHEGETEKALLEDQEALRLAPRRSVLYGDVTEDLAALGRFAEAKAAAEQAHARNLDGILTHRTLLSIAYIENDQAAVQRELQWMVGKPEEFEGFRIQAANAIARGQYRKAANLFQQAADSMERHGLKPLGRSEVGQIKATEEAWLGNCAPFRALSRLPSPPDEDPEQTVDNENLPALCGDTVAAQKVAGGTAKQRPLDTMLNRVYLPMLRASIELGRNQPEKAVELLQPADERGLAGAEAVRVRGLAYLRAKKGPEAAAQFRKLLDRPDPNTKGTALFFLAQAAKLSGDTAKAKRAYQDFFAFWKDADEDAPLLHEARKEYAALQ